MNDGVGGSWEGEESSVHHIFITYSQDSILSNIERTTCRGTGLGVLRALPT